MKTTFIALAILCLVILTGCMSSFDRGADKLRFIEQQYNVTPISSPHTIEEVMAMRDEVQKLKDNTAVNDQTTALHLLLDYRIGLLNSEMYLIDGFKWGEASTTEPGFGCRKGTPRIQNSTYLRNQSVVHGIAAADALFDLITNHPEEADSLNFGLNTVASIRITFDTVDAQVKKDLARLGLCDKEDDA